MQLSSNRFKSIAVTLGVSFWFFIISTSLGFFTLEIFLILVISVFGITQFFSLKMSRALDKFARINTKIFLGLFFIFMLSFYGLLFRILKIDLLRLKKQNDSYWLKTENLKQTSIFKQF